MAKWLHIAVWVLVIPVMLSACQGTPPEEQAALESPLGELQIESSAFESEGSIPSRHTCDGDDVSPPLFWSGLPTGAQSLVLICDDPDAPGRTWDHWLLFNIPPATRSLPEGIPADAVIEGVGVHGSNSWRRLGYGGPCPPQGTVHRYLFKLYALDKTLDLQAGASKSDIETEMEGHILAAGQLLGRYGR